MRQNGQSGREEQSLADAEAQAVRDKIEHDVLDVGRGEQRDGGDGAAEQADLSSTKQVG